MTVRSAIIRTAPGACRVDADGQASRQIPATRWVMERSVAEQDSRGVAASTATEQELQRSSDHFLAELGRIDGMERRKRDLPATDDEGLPLAHEIEDGSIGLVGLSRYRRASLRWHRRRAG